MLDLFPYISRIYATDDKPIFEEAANCAKSGAERAAYIMIWISCAESLKRRFREAQNRDVGAGIIVGEFEQKERDHKSVDKFLLDKAKEYGFLSDSNHVILLNIYEMRCLYGHPYEEAPTAEQVTHAAAMVVEHVLSQPVRLRYGFGKALLKSLLGEKNFLDDQASAVGSFATEILTKIDSGILPWFLNNYWTELEKMVDDASLKKFFLRGVWFSRAVLDHVGPQLFTLDQWHDNVGKFPRTLVRVLGRKKYFDGIGNRAQDSLVGAAFDQAKDRSSVLQHLDRLYLDGALSDRQQVRFTEYLAAVSPEKLVASGISLKTSFPQVISALKSHNWYTQKPIVDFVVARGASSVKELENGKQEELGRNILQVADGGEKSARKFLAVLTKDARKWPVRFVRGIALECFANEQQQIRFKDDHLAEVLKILDRRKPVVRSKIVNAISQAIRDGEPKSSYLSKTSFNKVVDMVEGYEWGSDLAVALRSRRKDLLTRSDDNDE